MMSIFHDATVSATSAIVEHRQMLAGDGRIGSEPGNRHDDAFESTRRVAAVERQSEAAAFVTRARGAD